MKPMKCPSKEAIIRFFEEDASEKERWRFFSHVLSCPKCLTIFEAADEIWSRSQEILSRLEEVDICSREAGERLRRISRQEIRLLRKGRLRRRKNSLRWLGISAAGMSLALIAAFVVVPTLLTQRKPAIERSVSGIEIILLKPQGTISTSALDFEWTPLPEIQNYHLEIYDQSLEPVYISSPLSSTRISLSNEVKGLIQKDRQYFWKVVAAPKGERSMIESEFGKFRLQK